MVDYVYCYCHINSTAQNHNELHFLHSLSDNRLGAVLENDFPFNGGDYVESGFGPLLLDEHPERFVERSLFAEQRHDDRRSTQACPKTVVVFRHSDRKQ